MPAPSVASVSETSMLVNLSPSTQKQAPSPADPSSIEPGDRPPMQSPASAIMRSPPSAAMPSSNTAPLRSPTAADPAPPFVQTVDSPVSSVPEVSDSPITQPQYSPTRRSQDSRHVEVQIAPASQSEDPTPLQSQHSEDSTTPNTAIFQAERSSVGQTQRPPVPQPSSAWAIDARSSQQRQSSSTLIPRSQASSSSGAPRAPKPAMSVNNAQLSFFDDYIGREPLLPETARRKLESQRTHPPSLTTNPRTTSIVFPSNSSMVPPPTLSYGDSSSSFVSRISGRESSSSRPVPQPQPSHRNAGGYQVHIDNPPDAFDEFMQSLVAPPSLTTEPRARLVVQPSPLGNSDLARNTGAPPTLATSQDRGRPATGNTGGDQVPAATEGWESGDEGTAHDGATTRIPCEVVGCPKTFARRHGMLVHFKTIH
ncbi:hypothetical protein GE09DRAFT_28868 [Coniochaeta sp. 2T2.1]|nr:hypothetical protein GE09DRAFT_28868 [Coniochaeta sp. 2T2.1]